MRFQTDSGFAQRWVRANMKQAENCPDTYLKIILALPTFPAFAPTLIGLAGLVHVQPHGKT